MKEPEDIAEEMVSELLGALSLDMNEHFRFCFGAAIASAIYSERLRYLKLEVELRDRNLECAQLRETLRQARRQEKPEA